MRMMHNGVDIYCLLDGAHCKADEEKRSPLDIEECPNGEQTCCGDCFYYAED